MKYVIANENKEEEVTLVFKTDSDGDPSLFAYRKGALPERILWLKNGRIKFMTDVSPELGFELESSGRVCSS